MRRLTIFPAIPQASNALARYLSELKNIPLITAEEEIRLARRIRAGDEQTLDKVADASEGIDASELAVIDRFKKALKEHFLDLIYMRVTLFGGNLILWP